MVFYRLRRRLSKKIELEYQFLKILYFSKLIPNRNKVVEIDFSEISKNRYLYAFLKSFDLNGYNVYIPKEKQNFVQIYQKKAEFGSSTLYDKNSKKRKRNLVRWH